MSLIYTLTDESPRLATESLLPIIKAFASAAGVEVQTSDISLAGRILAAQNASLPPEQQVVDGLAQLATLTADASANIIKLPNISASLPQLQGAIKELQSQGFPIPDYPLDPQSSQEREVKLKYDSVLGSAVNPVLRQGNSDRRVPPAAKAYARTHPHVNKPWAADSQTQVATMEQGDFFHNEVSLAVEAADQLSIRFVPADPEKPTLLWKEAIAVAPGDVFDATFMSATALQDFLKAQVQRAKELGLLFSTHLKATMMKVSDPLVFGQAITALVPNTLAKYSQVLADAGFNPSHGLAALYRMLPELPLGPQILEELETELANGPDLAMIDSDKGVTAFHVPSDLIIDASMPAMLRAGGKMWGADGAEHEVLAVIPDSTYASVYQTVINDIREHGALDPAAIGSVANVGLMAQAAEEYGSHDKTFAVPELGRVEVVSATGEVLMVHDVENDSIWRACLTRSAAIINWVKLAVERGRISGDPVVFWLNPSRPHDAVLLEIVAETLSGLNCDDVEILVMAPAEATQYSLDRMRAGLNTISATGNVLRDYLTDLFPILELGTSAKMLSIVPLFAGGGMFETGAGGSAPKQMQQLVAENHLRWDSLGEFLALTASLEHLARVEGNAQAALLAAALDRATARYLEENRGPGRVAGTPDNRAAHYYLARFWADELAQQTEDIALSAKFTQLARTLEKEEANILTELASGAGVATDLGGYYHFDTAKAATVMRPSATLNQAIASI